MNVNVKKGSAKTPEDAPIAKIASAPPEPGNNRRRLKRRATDPAPHVQTQGRSANGEARPQSAGRSKPKATIKRNTTGTRVGYDPYESGQLIKEKRAGVPRDLRSLGQWLKAGKGRKSPH